MSISLKPHNKVSLDEKIDSLVAWRKKYPKIQIEYSSDYELGYYAKTDEELSQLQEEYEKIRSNYDYVKHYKRKLNEDQISRGKEGDVRGIFGFSKKIEKLEKKYGIDVDEVICILDYYGTLEQFYEAYKNVLSEKLNEDSNDKKSILSSSFDYILFKTIKLVIDSDGNPNRGYDYLMKTILKENFKRIGLFNIYSSEKLKELINGLTEKEKEVLERRYGIKNGNGIIETYKTIGDSMGISKERVRQINDNAFEKITDRISCCIKNHTREFEFLTEEERKEADIIIKDIQLQNGDLSKKLPKLKEILEKIDRIKEKKTEENEAKEDDRVEVSTKEQDKKEILIEELNLSVRAYNCLTRAGIASLGDLKNMTVEELRKVRNLGKKSFDEIVDKMDEYGVSFKEDEEINPKDDNKGEVEPIAEAIIEEEPIVETDEEKEEITKFEDMTIEDLQNAIQQNDKTIEDNDETIKQRLIKIILEKQKIIEKQQAEIAELRNQKGAL